MISIIICSRTATLPVTLTQNIADTIGTEYEIIAIDNSANEFSIFEAYNLGVKKSKFPILVFMHDDIAFNTHDWGEKVANHFLDETIGCIGVAGAPYLPKNPASWWGTDIGYLYLLQSEKNNTNPILQDYHNLNDPLRQAVAVDGVWFCIRKKIFETISFDEKNFDGFHFYDLDISLQVFKAGYRIQCVNDILIHHFSWGVLDKNWLKYLHIFYDKWKGHLPVSAISLSLKEQCNAEYKATHSYSSECLRINGDSKENKKIIYRTAIFHLLSFKKCLLYYRTYPRLLKYCMKYFSATVGS